MARQRHRAGERKSRGGQAIIEFVVGLIAVLVLFAGLLQIGRLAFAHTRAFTDARAEAGSYAMDDVYTLVLPGPEYIRDWDRGPDGKRYSRDDEVDPADPATLPRRIVYHAKPDELEGLRPGNQVSGLWLSGVPQDGLGLVRGDSDLESVPVYPILRDLVYDAEAIDIEADAWMTWTKGLY